MIWKNYWINILTVGLASVLMLLHFKDHQWQLGLFWLVFAGASVALAFVKKRKLDHLLKDDERG